MSSSNSLLDLINRIWSSLAGKPTAAPTPSSQPDDALVTVLHPRVLVVNFDPVVDAQGTRLTQRLGWNNADDLIPGCIAAIDDVSYGLVKYRVVDRVDVNEIPRKADSYQYSVAEYLNVIQNLRTGVSPDRHHDPDGVDYWKIVNDYHLIERVMHDEIDEVWMFGGPYFGFYESRMVGKKAFWCNAPPLEHSDQSTRRFIIMGYNYERSVAEMIHDIGHRTEFIMAQVFDSMNFLNNAFREIVAGAPNTALFANPRNIFERFITVDRISPGHAQVGLVHFPPNADKDYDWNNPRVVTSACDDWLRFPDLQGTTRQVSCSDWGNGAVEQHHRWWFKRIPHVQGRTGTVANNWWKYVIDPNNVNV
ncbi:MAG TPA: hypothetical protein VIX58_04170 [Anaerolineae bacterium]